MEEDGLIGTLMARGDDESQKYFISDLYFLDVHNNLAKIWNLINIHPELYKILCGSHF